MLRINRLRIEIHTANGMYGFDSGFHNGVNFVASPTNTCGKSSILAAIYYCLGFEQIIGGVSGIGSKVLTSAFKSAVEDNGKEWRVTESGAFLEITNGNEIVTIYRNAVASDGRDNRLVTVYHGAYDSISDPKTQTEDMFVNVINSATSEKGFHTFLESFMHLELPEVRASDDNERKLYLQVVFSSMFIEQRHGWSDIFSGMPFLGIKDTKKRVIEYILNLDTLRNEKERGRLGHLKTTIERSWGEIVSDIQRVTYHESCKVVNVPMTPRVLTDKDRQRIQVLTVAGKPISLESAELREQYSALTKLKPQVIENFDALNAELSETVDLISSLETQVSHLTNQISQDQDAITRHTENLNIINADIRNNNDAARLQKFGSESTGEFSADTCPVCKQEIHDALLLLEHDNLYMNIEENIRHLKAQKDMLEFSLSSHKASKDSKQQQKEALEARLITLRRLALAIRTDLFKNTEMGASEAITLKRVEISRRIEILEMLNEYVEKNMEQMLELSKQWNQYLSDKSNLPKNALSETDIKKVSLLRTKFIDNLSSYHYSSIGSLNDIQISEETLLPIIDGFDMKFDSSASDGVRVIWAFTMALLQVSIKEKGNHPCILIFDEPAQQSIVSADMRSFINSLLELRKSCQFVVAITLNSGELVNIINNIAENDYNKIDVPYKCFKLFGSQSDSEHERSKS